jgi:tetratricopeptide (TPR) repeat protein
MNMPWPTPAGRSTSTRDPLPDAKSGDGSTGSGATARAVDDFTAWIETEPRSALAYHLRGGVYTDNYDYDRAIADFTGEIEIKPDNADAYRSRSLAYVKKQNPTTPAGLRRRSGKYNPAIARCGEVFRTKVARRLEMTRRQIQQRESGGRAPP